jgi:hypothetical protein
MPEPNRLPDDAFVVRCGQPPFQHRPLVHACRKHPDGPFGFSVQAAPGLTVEHLGRACRNNSVGFLTVGDIRRMGYEVIPTQGEAHHATVAVPRDWSREASEELASHFRPARNPSRKR